jgi:hypothetical protein
MNMRSLFLAAGLALLLPTAASAFDYAIAFSPRTGDSLLDTQLGDINVYASGNSSRFIDDVVVSFGAPRVLVQELYTTRHWAPGDIYYACAIANALGRPCREIVDIYERDHGQGWGAIAQRLGIKPGSAAFHALKGRVGNGHGKLKGAHGGGQGHGGQGHGGQGHGQGHGGQSQGGQSQGGQSQGQQGGQQGGKGKGRGNGRG